MNYYHLTQRPGFHAPEENQEWLRAMEYSLKCPECHELRRMDVLPDVPLQELPGGPIDVLFGLGLGVISVRLLEELGWEDVNRYLVLGRLLRPSGKPLPHCATFQGRCRTFIRGTQESTYRGLCSTCGAPWFHASGLTKDWYLLSTRLPATPISECPTRELVVTQEYVDRLSPAMRKRLRIAPLPVIDEPRDGLGELPF